MQTFRSRLEVTPCWPRWTSIVLRTDDGDGVIATMDDVVSVLKQVPMGSALQLVQGLHVAHFLCFSLNDVVAVVVIS